MKFRIALFILTLASIGMAIWLYDAWQTEKHTRKRVESNLNIVTNEYKAFKDTNYAQIQVLSMTVKEVKAAFPELEKQLKQEFGIKLKDAIQVNNTTAVVKDSYHLTIKDSVRVDSIPMEYLAYQDSFKVFRAERIKGEVYVTEDITRVPLLQVVSREPWKLKRILPWWWGKPRKIFQDIKSPNPRAKIEFSRTINFIGS